MEMCRVCLVSENGLHSMDETFVINYNLLTNLNITLLDGMPQFICKTCLDTVKYFIEFRDKSIAAETTLREIVSSGLKTETIKADTEFENTLSSLHTIVKNNIKYEIKKEKDEDSEGIDNFDVTFEEYNGGMKNLVKNEEIKRRKLKKKKIKKEKTRKIKIIEPRDDGRLFCGICAKTFEDKEELNGHLNTHKDDRQCKLCGALVNSASQLFAHRIKHLPASQFKCHICSKRYRSALYLEHHYRVLHIDSDDPKLPCNICLSTYSSPKKLKNHIAHCHSTVRYICDVCNKSCSSKASLKSHIKHHSKIKSYVCDLCGFSCNYSGGLKDHKIRRHSQKKIYCKNCTRPFSSQDDYERHKCKEKVRICPICGIQLASSSRLSKHMIRHSSVHQYECSRCPAKYKTKQALVAHTDRHDNNRTKQCEYCPAKFYTTTVLIKHRRTHTGEKPYVCKICNKGFTGGHNLKVHMKVHGEYLVVKRNTETETNSLNVTEIDTNTLNITKLQ